MSSAKYKHCYRAFLGLMAVLTFVAALAAFTGLRPVPVAAQGLPAGARIVAANDYGKYACGTGDERVITSIDFGCKGTDCLNENRAGNTFCTGNHSGIIDLLFAIIRFLSAGVGIVVIGSIVFAGIQYTTSRGDPNSTAAAMKRVRATAMALAIYIFAYAILNYLIPQGFFYK